MSAFDAAISRMSDEPKVWLITGVAGFIGSNLLEKLLQNNQQVIGMDNFSTGRAENLREVLSGIKASQRGKFRFVEGDIRQLSTCEEVCRGVDYVLHQAALGSVPRSVEDPISSNETNVSGFLNMLVASRNEKVKRFVYASSSAIYGDDPGLPKIEEQTGQPLSPYAVTKSVNELYANVFWRNYGLEVVGLRYFNVFGPRQDPHGAYAAVIPRWIMNMCDNETPVINGDGSVSRDFCYVANVVQANLLAASCSNSEAIGECFNIALQRRATLKELFDIIRCNLLPDFPHLSELRPCHREFRLGDIPHSLADISKARFVLGYVPSHTLEEGMKTTVEWFKQRCPGGGRK
ncbi:MAG: SDR family oxidoreductase [Verrucomicrobia bacterium]|nr:SDR family oxidoreductase [Verrucomicrobiota bacterium]